MKESQIREHLTKGWIRAMITFEVVGKPAKHVEQALADFIANIKKDERIIFLQEDREEAIEHEDGMFSAFSEAEMLAKDLETFTWLCINFNPASIEILSPDSVEIKARDITNWLNDLLAKTHEIGTNHRAALGTAEHLTIATNQLIKNLILLSVRSGDKTEEEIEKDTGIYAAQLDPFLAHLKEKGQIQQIGNKYHMAPPGQLLKPAKSGRMTQDKMKRK